MPYADWSPEMQKEYDDTLKRAIATQNESKIPKSILIVGKRWFDRVNGITYCTARCYVDGVLVHTTPYEYGYGEYYRQAAMEQLWTLKIIPPRDDRECDWQYAERIGCKIESTVSDVRRKGDLLS